MFLSAVVKIVLSAPFIEWNTVVSNVTCEQITKWLVVKNQIAVDKHVDTDTFRANIFKYTPEEIEWYGYSLREACTRLQEKLDAEVNPQPLKHLYRTKLIEELKQAQLAAKDAEMAVTETSATSWMGKMNPFSKKHET